MFTTITRIADAIRLRLGFRPKQETATAVRSGEVSCTPRPAVHRVLPDDPLHRCAFLAGNLYVICLRSMSNGKSLEIESGWTDADDPDRLPCGSWLAVNDAGGRQLLLLTDDDFQNTRACQEAICKLMQALARASYE